LICSARAAWSGVDASGMTSYAFGQIIGGLIMIYLGYRLVRRITRGGRARR
jgi:fluoride ion exporter CrcB/FEX